MHRKSAALLLALTLLLVASASVAQQGSSPQGTSAEPAYKNADLNF